MLRKSPTLAKTARMGHPTSKAKTKISGPKRILDIFLYGNVLLRHGKGGDDVGCV
jgi:hypothetical protein